jgi:selenide,water dikinase
MHEGWPAMTETLTPRRLTEFSHGAGCACKLDPSELTKVLGRLTPNTSAELLVGPDSGDDAAVWRLDAHRALVLTADFLTPVVDDARAWGRVAAANAASDVYAMGGRPLLALNLVCWNDTELSTALLDEVLAGAQETATAGGFVIAGGHSVTDPEPKYGMAVVGEAHPDHLLTNRGLRSTDVLLLTKPLGVGIITTAIKRGLASESVIEAAIGSMSRLNDHAAQVALASGATGATDVTGFGLLGHLGRMALESGVDVVIDAASVPILPGARALAEAGCIPGGSARNLRWVRDRVDSNGIDELDVTILGDAQTSGGLVFGVAADRADDALAQLLAHGLTAARIGRVAGAGTGRMRIS